MFSHQQRQNASLEQKDSSQKRTSTTQPISKAGLHTGLPFYLENRPVLRQDMERRFGQDFSRVRVHYSAAAEQSAADAHANAYTIGHDIVFGGGRLAPWTYEGRRLIAHELTHVVQADRAAANPARPSTQVEEFELEARQVAGTTTTKPAANVGTAAAPKSGTLTAGPVTVDYNLDAALRLSSIKVSDINLSDYPPDRQGPVTRHFKSGPSLQQLSSGIFLTRLVASLASQGVSDETRKKIEKVIEPIQSHFRGAIEDARKEFRAQFPAPVTLFAGVVGKV
ncbi:MAG TPA: DUF4157 domain-containing protein [Pyrinomonadaceae bacterium]|jgi:hypothetical protein